MSRPGNRDRRPTLERGQGKLEMKRFRFKRRKSNTRGLCVWIHGHGDVFGSTPEVDSVKVDEGGVTCVEGLVEKRQLRSGPGPPSFPHFAPTIHTTSSLS